jgi:catecholate siderophore receptor
MLAAGGAMAGGKRLEAQAVSGPAASSAFAGDEAAAEGSAPAPAPAHRFDIPAGPLTVALDAYKRVTGLQVAVQIPADKLATFQSAGVQGTLSDPAALRQILEKTGLTFRFTGAGRVEIGIRNTEQVDVTAAAATALALQQFPETLLNTPQTAETVPQFVMQDEQAVSLRDTLRNVPGISMAAGEGGSQGDSLTIRGFNARNDMFLDGIRDFGSYYRDAFDFENVDVLEGPAGVEFGRGSTGGVVNQETKQPELNQFVHVDGQFGTDLMRRVTVDVNEPLKNFGDGAAFRLNAVGMDSMVAERDIAETRRFGIAPAISFGLDSATRYEVQYLHESENSTPDYGLPYFGPGVAKVNRSTYYGFANSNYLRTGPDVVTGNVEHDLNEHATVRNVLRWANYPRNVDITEPQINTAGTINYMNADGGTGYENADTQISAQCAIAATASASCYPLDTPLSQVSVNRNQLASRSTEDMLWDQASVIGRFDLLHVANDGLIIVEGGRERSDPDRQRFTMPYVPAIHPNPYDPFAPVTATDSGRTYVSSQSFGFGFNDTMTLRRWLMLSGGVRWDYFNTNAHTAALVSPATNANQLIRQATYRAAIVVKPRPEGSLYFDWGTSFDPSAESLSLSANNATAPPEENETYELGAKWDYLRDRLNISGSIFRTEKDNAHETDPNSSANTLTVGTYIVRGVQLGALGHLPQHFDLVVGYAFLDGFLENSALNASPFSAVNAAFYAAWQTALKTNPNAVIDPRYNTAPFYINPNGFPIQNAPKNSANLWVTHGLLKGFTGGVGGNYLGARRASSGVLIGVYNTGTALNPASVPLAAKAIPGYYVLNLMVRRPISERIDFQANINNITNKFYIDEPHPNHLVPGEGLNAQFGVRYKF